MRQNDLSTSAMGTAAVGELVLLLDSVARLTGEAQLRLGRRRSALALYIGLVYLALFLLSSLQLFQIVRNKHRLWSLQTGFLSLAWVWTAFRAILFLIPLQPSFIAYFIEWMPTTLQFAMFCCFVYFYAYIVDRETVKAEHTSTFLISATILATVTTIACCVLWKPLGFAPVLRFHSVLVALLFLILGFMLLRYTVRTRDAESDYGYQPIYSTGPVRRHARMMRCKMIIASVLTVVFVSRAFYDIPVAIGLMGKDAVDQHTPVMGSLINFQSEPTTTYQLLMLSMWEILPTVLLLWYFWDLPVPPQVEPTQGSVVWERFRYGALLRENGSLPLSA